MRLQEDVISNRKMRQTLIKQTNMFSKFIRLLLGQYINQINYRVRDET